MQELPFLHSAHRLMLIDICMKFREDSFRGFQVTERTRFVTDRQTDRQKDIRTPGEKQYVSQPFGGGGGRHKYTQACKMVNELKRKVHVHIYCMLLKKEKSKSIQTQDKISICFYFV